MCQQSLRAVFFTLEAGRFRDAIAIQHDPRSCGQINDSFREVTSAYPQRNAALAVHKACLFARDPERLKMSGTGEGKSAGRRIKNAIDQSDKFSRREVGEKKRVEPFQND